jgi:phosphoribosylanthranilate isomerase
MFIKVCGMTTPEAVAAAIAARVDAIGFVFAESVRKVTPEVASQLAAAARGRVKLFAVTKNPTQRLVDEILDVFEPDVLQSDAQDFATVRVPRGLEVIPVLRSGAVLPQPLPPKFVFEGPVSGTGVAFDWTIAAHVAGRGSLILAGGLNAANVAEAITAVRPFGVDVSSGVEARPGVKSPQKIAEFVSAARSARLKEKAS